MIRIIVLAPLWVPLFAAIIVVALIEKAVTSRHQPRRDGAVLHPAAKVVEGGNLQGSKRS